MHVRTVAVVLRNTCTRLEVLHVFYHCHCYVDILNLPNAKMAVAHL